MVSPGRVAFSAFGLDIMWYGILIGIGFMLSAYIAYTRAHKHNLDQDFMFDVFICLVPAAIIGARAYYVLFKWDEYKGNWSEIFNTRNGGLAIHGAIILCAAACLVLCKVKKKNFLSLADLLFCVLPLGQAIGRWGNFFNQEAHGMETSLPWAQIINGVGYHPTFLYESVWCLLVFIILFLIDEKKREFDGQIMTLYMMLYSAERFFVEEMRTDSLMIGHLKQAQVLSLIVFIAGFALYFYFEKRSKEVEIIAEEKTQEVTVEEKTQEVITEEKTEAKESQSF